MYVALTQSFRSYFAQDSDDEDLVFYIPFNIIQVI